MKLILIAILLSVTLLQVQAKNFSYEQIAEMPKSIEKDYYIWRLLKQKNTSKKEAQKILKDVKHISVKIKKAYKKKVGKNPPPPKGWYIIHVSPEIKAKRKKRKAKVKAITKSKNPFDRWMKLSNSDKIYVFNNAGKDGRKLFDRPVSKELWQKLSLYSKFDKCIKKINKENLKKLKKSFIYPPLEKSGLDYQALSILAFYTLRRDEEQTAMKYFKLALKKAKSRESIDKILFWQYMISKDKKYLKKIVTSYDVNIYTLLARDFLKLEYPEYITPALPKVKLLSEDKISSPIYWAKLKKKIFSKSTNLDKLTEKYNSYGTVGFYSYIKSKQSRYKEHYFPMPYRDLLSKLPKTRQAIMYAIARQESRFIPASVSSSYALGMMQIMPFLVDHLAKQRKEEIDYDDMFNPRTSLIYANEHMNYLTKWLQHPLYIAYAYNAGIGFTSKMLRKKDLFVHNKGYEPYLSIEKLPNSQANKYGKHVLVNYVIYMNKLGVQLRMIDLLSTLHIPSKTDKFRK
ncbi:MAG: lytic transglycosylase domain-containing protein [Sulfurovum sp.]|nr:lytic transglycosylase domain-containing protein [Sulfurovum sp.]